MSDAVASDLVNIEVNGVPMKARKGEMIIRATDLHNVYIPRFCYHDKLPIAANCRMCLVEVEKAPKPMPACATPVAEGMKIFTKSPKAIAAQKATMEFLLINHPLDCPICDQGGECELQDLAVGYGRDISRYAERKRVVKDQSLGPLISTDMTRCIHCTRCVRFGQDVAGIQELGTLGRGEQTQISTYIEKSVDHELSGNIIDLCPVGALNSKPFRFHARAWEMTQAPLVSPHDGFGTNLYGHVLRGKLMRVVPRPAEDLNETWIADRDRFSYEGIYTSDRLQTPMVRAPDGALRSCDWDVALTAAAEGLRRFDGADIGVLTHPSGTLEEHYLLNRIATSLGCSNIDHRLRQCDTRDQGGDGPASGLGMNIGDIDRLQAVLVVGADLRQELPLLAHRLRKAALGGAQVSFLNAARYQYLFPVQHYLVAGEGGLVAELAGVVRAALGEQPAPAELAPLLAGISATTAQRALADSLRGGERKAVWLGALALRDGRYAELRRLARVLAQLTGAALGELLEGANGVGARLAGALPHRAAAGQAREHPGRSAHEMLSTPLAAYLLHGVEPGADSGRPETARTLAAARFVVAVVSHVNDELSRTAQVLLPAGSFAESSGTYVNLEGRWQSFAGAARAVGAARPGWQVLRALANLLGVVHSDYPSSEAVRDELKALIERAPRIGYASSAVLAPAGNRPTAPGFGIYQVDALVRRATSLQATHAALAG